MFSGWWGSNAEETTNKQAESEQGQNRTENVDDTDTKPRQEKSDVDLAKDVAKNVGSFLFSMASVATKTASIVKDSVKETVETQTFMGDFNKEQEKFITEKHSKRSESAVPPWVGYNEEDTMKSQILALSTDERNFLRDPPTGAEFYYDYEVMFPVALATLSEDQELQKMRFQLVPKKVTEERFWRNYFYRVSLIKQSSQLTSLAASTGNGLGTDSNQKNCKEDDKKSNDINNTENAVPKVTNKENTMEDLPESLAESPLQTEFISDTFSENHELSSEDLKQIGMDRLKLEDEAKTDDNSTINTTTTSSEETTKTDLQPTKKPEEEGIADWEKELQEELQDYEVVADDDVESDPAWDKEIEDMLEAEVGDIDVDQS